MAEVALETAHKCAMPSARIFRNKRRQVQPPVCDTQDKGPSLVTAIGVPACSTFELSLINLNKTLLWNL
ncbi:MAG: hypothetical protein ACI92Z_002986 [Paracoccaceae bacterium]|jgi:hypothetical protein